VEQTLTSLKIYLVIGRILYYAVLPVFCMITAYFRVEEVQATDAV
jgi:hypothetical protein